MIDIEYSHNGTEWVGSQLTNTLELSEQRHYKCYIKSYSFENELPNISPELKNDRFSIGLPNGEIVTKVIPEGCYTMKELYAAITTAADDPNITMEVLEGRPRNNHLKVGAGYAVNFGSKLGYILGIPGTFHGGAISAPDVKSIHPQAFHIRSDSIGDVDRRLGCFISTEALRDPHAKITKTKLKKNFVKCDVGKLDGLQFNAILDSTGERTELPHGLKIVVRVVEDN